MGQSSSRPRSAPQSTPQAERREISGPTIQRDAQGRPIRSEPLFARERPHPRPSASTAAPQDAAKRSRRQSMLRALRPSSQPASVASSSRAQTGQPSSSKKRWRSSRRWSKTPEERNEVIEPTNEPEDGAYDNYPGQGAGLTSDWAGGGSSSGMAMHGSRASSPFSTSRPSTPLPDNLAEMGPELLSGEEQQASENIGAWLGGSPSPTNARHAEDINREVLDFLGDAQEAVTPNSDPREPEAHIEPSASSDTQHTPRNSRFQAPSTLVVVQGVVNAQDPPPPHPPSQAHHAGSRSSLPRRSSSTPGLGNRPTTSSEDRARSRNRLSSLIRPTSMLGRNVTDEVTNDSPNADQPSDVMGTTNSNATGDPNAGSQPNEGVTTSPAQSRTPRGLSAGSIDVLGTLLSVAATATAASLFTPPTSAAAILPNHTTILPSPPSIPTSRPLSPTPTSGLGATNPLGGLGLHNQAQTSSTTVDGRDRMRHAWDSIREMVGLNSRNSPEVASSTTDTSPPPPEQRMRTGDAMLADMARLLNAGLGLPPPTSRPADGTSTTDASVPPSSAPQLAESSPPPSAEGSFERFLLNLQTDLRNILSESSTGGSTDDVNSSEPSSATDLFESPSHSRSGTSNTSESQTEVQDESAISSTSLRPPSPPVLYEATDPEITVHIHDHDQIEDNTIEAEEDVSVRPRVPTPIPSMWSSTPAYNETRERVARAQRAGFADVPSRSRPPPPSSTQDGSNREERDRPAVNLWRLYRFSPIPATQAQENVSRTIRSPLATPAHLVPSDSGLNIPVPADAPEPNPSPAVSHEDTPAHNAAPDSNAQASTPEPAAEGTPFVVPVIVVGLQSVETRGQDDDDDGLQWAPPPRESPAGSPSRTPDHPVAWASQPTPPAGAAGRSWGSRAANALRGLRPGARRPRDNRLSDGTGSRTFLIYVIGGYYPPGHHMVTGSDQLDSYDALWELAELLGQAKPPTTTQEEIEKSGLEVIKASQLTQYEASGKISSNCIDRCLVCLEDYEGDEDVRILSCRHGFHKQCVDKWMQVGRNNCPACRTKGVDAKTSPSHSPNTSSASPLPTSN